MPTDAGLFADGVPGALRAAGACLAAAAQERHGPYSGASPERLAEGAAGVDPFPQEGAGLDAALAGLGRLSLRHGVDPAHPACAAHLHCQPLAAAVAADALAAAANQSLDSWDQGPMATHLERRLVAGLAAQPRRALVATAGTTDFGSIDPLPDLAERARERGLWLHVDAAWGGGLLFSDRHRGLLAGIEAADSVAVDFHKLLWQPAGCGVFLVRDRALLAPLAVTVPYLNPSPVAGGPDGWEMAHLVGRSLATTRRFAALTPLLSFQAVGYEELLAAEPVAGDPGAWQVGLPGGVAYRFRAGRRLFDGWRVAEGSVRRRHRAGEEPATDPGRLLLDLREAAGVPAATAAHLLKELRATQVAGCHLAAGGASAAELLDLDHPAIEGEMGGHPWIAPNKGRRGFGYGDYLRHAPERRRRAAAPPLAPPPPPAS